MAPNGNGSKHVDPNPQRPRAKSKAPSPLADSVRTSARAVKEVTQSLALRAAESAADLKRQARERSDQLLAAQKDLAAQNLGQMGAAIRQAADRFYEDHGEGAVARYVHSAADGVDQAAQYLAERDLPALARDASQAVKRHPAWFLGGMLLAGLAVGRFVKAGTTDNLHARRRPRPPSAPV